MELAAVQILAGQDIHLDEAESLRYRLRRDHRPRRISDHVAATSIGSSTSATIVVASTSFLSSPKMSP